jgi:hypothetical protein
MESPKAEEKIDSINRIALLEKAVQELGRPWYKHALTMITGVALVVSVASAVFTYISKNTEDIRSKREELRSVISNIIDLRTAYNNDPANVNHFVKQELYITAAEDLIKEFPEKVSSQEYIILSREMYWHGYAKKAEEYGKKAVEYASGNTIKKAVALRSIAELYYWNGIKDFEKGRRYYKQAVDLLSNINDEYIIGELADTYQFWGLNELRNSFVVEGNQKVDLARKHYIDLEKMGLYPSGLSRQ